MASCRAAWILGMGVHLAALGCAPEAGTTAASGRPIVDGVNEAGFPAVGALVTELPGEDHSGSFCSATLIAPSWVLTAAHCVDDLSGRVPDRVPPSPTDYLHFFVGENSREPGAGARTFPARRIVISPEYARPGSDRSHDIALVELERPVDGISPIPPHRGRLDNRSGASLTYVGFGAARSNGNGSGRKRSTTLTLHVALPAVYITEQIGGGVCFGDSGGPGLLDVGGGALEVIGVNSTVFGNPSCEEYSTQIRVDAHQTWIDRVMGVGNRSCRDDSSLCQCEAACGDDGVCNDALCGRPACTDISFCLRFCSDQLCALSCLLNAAPEPRYLYETLSGCISRECPDRRNSCIADRCRRELVGCDQGLAAVTGTQACAGIFRCQEGCSDVACEDACFFEGRLAEQAERDRVEDCIEARCDGRTGDAFELCAATACRDQLLACLPDEACRITGGDCGPGAACRPEAWAASYCLPAEDVAVGEACVPGGVDCVDGALCVGGQCREVCADATDCERSFGPCRPARAEALPFSIGVCSLDCRDADADGACDDVDCDPWDASRFPGAEEICDPAGIDEDCDGMRNEGCVSEAPDAGAPPDLGQPDAGATTDAGDPASPPPMMPGEGCRCASGPSAPAAGWALLLLLFGCVRGRARSRR